MQHTPPRAVILLELLSAQGPTGFRALVESGEDWRAHEALLRAVADESGGTVRRTIYRRGEPGFQEKRGMNNNSSARCERVYMVVIDDRNAEGEALPPRLRRSIAERLDGLFADHWHNIGWAWLLLTPRDEQEVERLVQEALPQDQQFILLDVTSTMLPLGGHLVDESDWRKLEQIWERFGSPSATIPVRFPLGSTCYLRIDSRVVRGQVVRIELDYEDGLRVTVQAGGERYTLPERELHLTPDQARASG